MTDTALVVAVALTAFAAGFFAIGGYGAFAVICFTVCVGSTGYLMHRVHTKGKAK